MSGIAHPVCIWPPELAELRMACAADEVASTLRHEALNEIAGLGALIYRLRRRMESHGELQPDVLSLLDAVDARLTNAPARLATRFLPSAKPGPRADLLACVRALVQGCHAPDGGALPAEVVSALTPAEAPTAAVDPRELQVAAGCLLENAIEAHLRAGISQPVRLTVRGDRERRTLEVQDHGPSLDPAIADRLLDPFFSGHPGQTGLGLKIARRIAHRWNGELLVGPGPSAGLKVELVLPTS